MDAPAPVRSGEELDWTALEAYLRRHLPWLDGRFDVLQFPNGAANLTYGSSFPTPPGGQLGCDSNGRCIVIAKQDDGTAMASAYQVNAAGTWADVTGQPGITSATSDARTLPVGDGIGVAVQDQADGSTVWIVYGWDGGGYAVKGCTAAPTPDGAALSMSSCLS